jgi:hypothetical protein
VTPEIKTLIGGPVVRYLNQGGAQVGVYEAMPTGPVLPYRAGCWGCLETYGSAEAPGTLGTARAWAASHAEQCRALPQPTEPTGPDFRALAHEYALKAADAIDGRGLTQAADKYRIEAAETYAGLAGVYAMLAN